MPGPGANGPFQCVVEPRNDGYHPSDDRWRGQVATLYLELDAEVDTVHRPAPVPGAKGTVDQFVIALGGAGAFTAAVECFRAWMGRDRGRSIDVRWDDNGVERFVTLTGDAVDNDSVRVIAQAAARRIGGAEWPAGTGPS